MCFAFCMFWTYYRQRGQRINSFIGGRYGFRAVNREDAYNKQALKDISNTQKRIYKSDNPLMWDIEIDSILNTCSIHKDNTYRYEKRNALLNLEQMYSDLLNLKNKYFILGLSEDKNDKTMCGHAVCGYVGQKDVDDNYSFFDPNYGEFNFTDLKTFSTFVAYYVTNAKWNAYGYLRYFLITLRK